MKNQITITIAGKVKSGKSRISYIIKEMLKIHGLRVHFNPAPDFDNELLFNKTMRHDLDEAIEGISKDSIVVVKEVQEQR